MDPASNPLQPENAAVIARLVQANLDERERLRRNYESQLQLQRQQLLQQQQLQQPIQQPMPQINPGALPATPRVPSRLPPPVSRENSLLSTPSLSRSFSSTSMTASDELSTPPSQQSTPAEKCPPRPRKSKAKRDRLRRLRVAMYCDDNDDYFDDVLQDSEMTPSEQLSQDRRDILHPILSFFDARWLALRHSPLFKHEKKKTPNPDGSFSMKKNETLQLDLWSRLIRRALQKIMGHAYLNNHMLTARYRFAARKIVCKRRANHVQHWRLHGTHKRLIYGDSKGRSFPPRKSKLCKRIKFSNKLTGRKRGRAEAVDHEDEQADVRVDAARDENKSCVDMPIYPDGDPNAGACSDTTLPYDDGDAETDDAPSPPCSMKTHKTRCSVCKKPLECRSAFPQDHEDWAVSVKRPMRCAKCWNEHVQKKMLPDLNERIQQKALKQKSKEETGEAAGGQPKKKRAKRKTCRCGSTTHKMVTHRDCPLNKRNLVEVPAGEPAPAQTTSPSKNANASQSPTRKIASASRQKLLWQNNSSQRPTRKNARLSICLPPVQKPNVTMCRIPLRYLRIIVTVIFLIVLKKTLLLWRAPQPPHLSHTATTWMSEIVWGSGATSSHQQTRKLQQSCVKRRHRYQSAHASSFIKVSPPNINANANFFLDM